MTRKPIEWFLLSDAEARRFYAKVSLPDEGGCMLWTASIQASTGYGQVGATRDRRRVILLAHRVAHVLSAGLFPSELEVDHTCHVRACVAPHHLRAITHAQNQQNREGAQADNLSSGVRNVYRHRSGGWRVQLKHAGRAIQGGSFPTIREAEEAATALRLRVLTHSDPAVRERPTTPVAVRR